MKFLKWLNFGKERHHHRHLAKKNKDEFIDLSEMYRSKQKQNGKPKDHEPEVEFIEPVHKLESYGGSNNGELDLSNSVEEKRRRLAKRIADLTSKIEELSNKVYLLTQRVEVLEKRTRVNDYQS